jgi:AcrR family transcriptional regulator
VSSEARRQAILEAALEAFSAHGFAAAKLDDVAAAAGVAKGTLYLYFPHKEALFEELIRSAAVPVIDKIAAAAAETNVPFNALLERIFELFRTEVLGTRRKLILRLLLAEGARFPKVAEFYYREVLSRALAIMEAVATRAAARGELPSDAAARFPQLIVAPLLVAVLWDSLFARFEPLDVEGLLAAHRDVLRGRKGTPQCHAEP